MTRSADIPDAFDVYTVVLLRRPAHAPALSDAQLDELQRRHLAYRAQLHREGSLVVNGPLREQSDESLRGLSIFAAGPDEARRLSEGDPSVQAGRLDFEVMQWWVAAESLAFPGHDGPVGDRRQLED